MEDRNSPDDDPFLEMPVRRRVPLPAAVAGSAGEEDQTLEYWYFCGEGSLLRPD